MSYCKKEITDEEIYILREKGLTYEKIVKYFTKQGKQISRSTVRNRCKKIYKAKHKKEPKVEWDIKNNSKLKITDKEIYALREKGLGYRKIVQYFSNQGKKISYTPIRNRCKEIYANKEEPRVNPGKKVLLEITYEEIYVLREKGLTYEEIAEYFTKQGKKVNKITIGKICKEIYANKEEPKVKRGILSKITDEEIYEQRKKGLTYREIAEHFTEQGRKISRQRIEQRYKQMCKKGYKEGQSVGGILDIQASEKAASIDEEELRVEILRLQETKGATIEQMEEIAELYGISLKENVQENDENDSNGER